MNISSCTSLKFGAVFFPRTDGNLKKMDALYREHDAATGAHSGTNQDSFITIIGKRTGDRNIRIAASRFYPNAPIQSSHRDQGELIIPTSVSDTRVRDVLHAAGINDLQIVPTDKLGTSVFR